MSKVIRTEVQVTPTIDLMGEEKYYWQVFQIVSGVKVTIQSGFENSFLSASSTGYEMGKKYIKE